MTVKKQLENLLQRANWVGPASTLNIDDNFSTLIKKLIAERPYEPGETILVGLNDTRAKFLCVDPDNPGFVWAITEGSLRPSTWRIHKPLPKTTRVKPVPEEVIRWAKEILHKDAETKEDTGEGWYKEETIRMAEWLANPENWEGNND